MKDSGILIFLVVSLLLVNCVFAVPPQRLIVQFDGPLSTEQQQVFYQRLESIIGPDVSVLPHSTDQRWIVVFNPGSGDKSLENAINELSKVDRVQYVEPDRLLNLYR